MLIYDERTNPIVIDSIHTPLMSSHMWTLDLEIMDFVLSPIVIIEETFCPSLKLNILGFEFILPANWFVVVYDTDTTQIDVVKISDIAGQMYSLLGSGPDIYRPSSIIATVVEYIPQYKNVNPSLNKHQMLCHPVAPGYWINISPVDPYNKYLKDKIVGDIF